jgi:hypothetical protein
MKTQGFERRFSQNLAPVSQEKPQNPYLAYISHLFSKPYLTRTKFRVDIPYQLSTVFFTRGILWLSSTLSLVQQVMVPLGTMLMAVYKVLS